MPDSPLRQTKQERLRACTNTYGLFIPVSRL